jgi:hypothetical protein
MQATWYSLPSARKNHPDLVGHDLEPEFIVQTILKKVDWDMPKK